MRRSSAGSKFVAVDLVMYVRQQLIGRLGDHVFGFLEDVVAGPRVLVC